MRDRADGTGRTGQDGCRAVRGERERRVREKRTVLSIRPTCCTARRIPGSSSPIQRRERHERTPPLVRRLHHRCGLLDGAPVRLRLRRGIHLRAQPRRRRLLRRRDRAPGARGGRRRRRQIRAGHLGAHLHAVARQHPGLVHQSPALVGPPHPRLVRRGGQHLRRAGRGGRAATQRRRGRRSPDPGRGRARHLVLVRALAVLHPRLAGADRRARDVLPDLDARHGLRHHLLLGRPHGHVRALLHGRRGAVPRRLHARARARRGRPEDVQVQGQRARPARHHRRHRARGAGGQAHERHDAAASRPEDRGSDPRGVSRRDRGLRHRRAPLHLRLARLERARHPLRPQARRGLPELLQQALERDAVRADEHAGSEVGAAGSRSGGSVPPSPRPD